MLLLFECITCSSSMSLEEINVVPIVNYIFHLPDFLRLFMMSFKDGLISFRHSLIDSALLLSPLLCLLLLFYNNAFLVVRKGS